MADEPPILDYQPAEENENRAWPLIPRIIMGLVALFVTLLAGIFLAAGFVDLCEGMSVSHFLFGWILVGIAYMTWKPVGLRIFPWRKK
jgi:hypothetical protein